MNILSELTKEDIRLPSPPAIAIRILKAVKSEEADYDELSKIIMADPALAAKTLKIVNSSFYGLSHKVDNLKKAISILGLNAVTNICLSFVIASELSTGPQNGFNFDFFWKRAVTAAVAAELTAEFVGYKNDATFVIGLLQDIGIAVMYFCRKNDYLNVLNEKKVAESPVDIAEEKIFGFNHQEVGYEILKMWGLPEKIYAPLRYHHKNKPPSPEQESIVDMVYLSDKISSVYHGVHGSDKVDDISRLLGNKYGKNEAEIKDLIDAVADKSIEVLSLFEIDPADMRPYSQILQEANEELSKLNLTYERLLIKYKESRVRSEKLAEELKIANERLSLMAVKDSLTGLYNHGFFLDALDLEFKRAVRYKRHFSLIMIDIDDFKKVNDAFGHRTGDAVLQKTAELMLSQMRNSDTLARYGGEEFGIVVPETDLKGSVGLGERIRKLVEQTEIQTDSKNIKITVSVGVVTYMPGKEQVTTNRIMDAADAALYKSKNSGKNTLKVMKIGE